MNHPKILTQTLNDSGQFEELNIKKRTAHLKANCIGCFMLNGHDNIAFSESH